MKRVFCGLVCCGLFLSLVGPAPAQYTVTTFDLPGASDTEAHGINNAGQIVGWYLDADNTTHSFLATPQ